MNKMYTLGSLCVFFGFLSPFFLLHKNNSVLQLFLRGGVDLGRGIIRVPKWADDRRSIGNWNYKKKTIQTLTKKKNMEKLRNCCCCWWPRNYYKNGLKMAIDHQMTSTSASISFFSLLIFGYFFFHDSSHNQNFV